MEFRLDAPAKVPEFFPYCRFPVTLEKAREIFDFFIPALPDRVKGSMKDFVIVLGENQAEISMLSFPVTQVVASFFAVFSLAARLGVIVTGFMVYFLPDINLKTKGCIEEKCLPVFYPNTALDNEILEAIFLEVISPNLIRFICTNCLTLDILATATQETPERKQVNKKILENFSYEIKYTFALF